MEKNPVSCQKVPCPRNTVCHVRDDVITYHNPAPAIEHCRFASKQCIKSLTWEPAKIYVQTHGVYKHVYLCEF